jgi:hypothetical protein|nr:MAG TPA: crystallin beta/gamma motif-containing protein [Caudoviricetes sp.]
MDPRLEEIPERVLKGEAYGRYNPDAMKARTVDPDNLPDWAKPQEPKPSTWQRAKDFAGDVVENGISAITESKTEDAVNQAKVDYNTYQNQEYAQPVGLSNMLDSARNGVNNLLNARIVDTPSMIGSAMADVGRARAEEYQAAFNDFQNPVEPDGGIPTAAKQILAFPVAYVKATELYNNFNFQWGTPEKNYISEELGRAYGVDSSIFYDDRDAYIRGAQILAGFKALDKRVGDNVDRDDPAAFRAYLKEYYPSIINSSPETFQSKIKNAEDVKQIAELFRTPQLVRDYFYSVSERGNIYKKAYDEKRYLTEEEVARAEELNKRLQEYNKQMPQMHDHPLYGVLAQTGVQVAGMGSDALWGAAAAAVVGGTTQLLTQNPALSKKTASYAFQAGSMYGMFQRQVGEKYVEYLSYQNEDGTRTLTPELAARAAMIETGIETGIEFWNYKSIMRTLSGADRAAIQDIVAKNHGNAEAIRGGLRAYLANAVKAWAPRVKEEVLEEAYQSTTSDLMHNAIVALNPGTKEQYITPGEILGNSAQAMVDAVPSVVGMVAAGDVVSNIRQVRSMAAIYNLHKNLTEEEIQNAELNGILKDVQENQKTSKLAKEDPRAYMQVLKAEADKAGIPNVYVDTEMLMQEPGGREVIEKLGEQSGYTKAQVQETINSKGELEVPTAVYCQVALPSSVGDKVIDMTTSSPDINCTARQKDTIKRFQQNVKALAEQDEQEVQEIIPTIVNENFSDEDERKLASEIISGNPNDVQNAYRKALRGAEQEYKNILREVWEREEAASKENHDGTRIVEDKYADDNGNVRVVHNHRTWRDKWWTDYFGIQTPTVEKKEQFAYDIMTGAVAGGPNSLARIRDMAANAGDMDEVGKIDAEMKANKERLDAMANTIATLRGMKDKIAKIQNVETTITRGMTPEAYRVYQRTTDLLNHSVGVNKKVQQAARYDGVLFARMCQRLAEEWTRQGKKTTAEDIANTLQFVSSGSVTNGDSRNEKLAQVKQAKKNLNNDNKIWNYNLSAWAKDKQAWNKKRLHQLFKVMSAPSVLRIIGTAQNDIVAYGDIFNHAIRPDHPGLTENELSDLPKKLSDPLMVLKNGQNYVFAIDVKTQTGATVVVPIKINEQKKAPNGKSILVINRIASVYPKTQSKTNAQADYNWFNNSIAKNQLVYINKKRSTHWLAGLGHLKPSSGHASLHASIANIINNPPQNVKTENDLKNYRNTHMPLYQTAWHGSPNNFDNFMLSHMGEGEGAQVHGWGLYFAKNRDTAERYKVSTGNTANFLVGGKEYYSNGDWIYEADGTPIEHSSPLSILAPFIDEDSTQESVLKDVDKYIKMDSAPDASEGEKQELERLKKAKEVLEGGRFSMKKPSENHRLYEVNIPDDDSLLDEQKSFSEQPEKVKRGIEQAFKSVDDNLKENFVKRVLDYNDEGDVLGNNYVFDEYKAEHQNEDGTVNYTDFFKELDKKDYGVDGQAIYDGFSSVGANFVKGFNDENASRLLNKYGVKGITYEGRTDGRCFVVFDDTAISMINKYRQEQAQIQGQTTVTGDMISLFDAADQSTFMHETAHWYLINMRKLALNEKASRQFVEDFMTLQQWFGNKKIDADISVEQHEKFARGFEAYLRTGKAPAPQLHGIFNRFKSWLTSIYRDFKQLGGKPTKEVSAVMDRMLATQDEIDMAMKEQMVDDFKRAGGLKTMSGENAHTWERWYNKVRQEAEEKVMGQAMRDLAQADQKDIQEVIDTQRQIALSEMKRDPFWIADEAYRATGDESILATFNLTPQEYADELKKRGGSIEAALDARMEDFEKETRDSAMDIQTITEEAKKAVQTSEYQEMLHALEYEALAQKAKQFIAGEDDKATKAQTKEDKRVAKENAEAEAAAEKDRKISEKLTMREEARNAKVNEAEAEVESIRKGMRIVRDTVLTTLKERREAARIAMAKLPINQATNVSLWARKLGQKQNDVYNYMTRGRWDLAARAKQDQLMMAAMVTEAGKLKVQIDKQAAGIQKRVQTLQKGVERMPSQERYWYQHIAYVLGLSRADGLAPAEGAKQLSDVLMEMAGVDQSGNAEVPVPQWMNSLMNQQVCMGIEKLSPNGWAKVVNVMKALYKMGMDKDKLFVVSAEGVNPTISETAQALAENLLEHNGLHTKADVYSENTFLDKRKANLRDAKEFTGSAFKNLMTPLTILQRMDGYEGKNGRPVAGMAIKTLYDPVERAQNAEIKLLAEFADGLKDAFGTYADEDLDDLHNKRIYRFGNRILTKEEIMCMALTSGTASGYKRVLDNEETGQEFTSLAQRERVLADAVNEAFSNLDERDWTTITKIWNLMGSHYADESGVKERTTGIPLDKLAHRTFSVNGKDGKAYTLQGGYYPVAYDSSKSVKASNLETQDTLKSMAPGALRMGQGKDFTKKREKTVTGRPLLLSFDTISRKGSEMMHYIAYRETALDVSRIINNEAFKHAVTASMGMQEYKILQDWASDIWVPKQEDQALWAKLIRFFRSKTTMAVLGFRTSTMLLNASNAAVMIEHVGPAHFMGYMEKFYSSLAKNTRYVNSLSPFMAERSERMDTNLREAMEKSQMEVKGGFTRNPIWQGAKKLNTAIRENAFKLIGLTDNMFAYPLWYGEYMRTLNEELQAGKTNDEAQKAAVSAGDRAVIRVIGSGEIKDLSPVQKGGEIAKIFTMFYTFANAQWNIMANKHYAGLQAAEKAGRTGVSRYASMEYFIPMAHHFLTMGLMGAAIEMAIRGAMDALSGEDGDKEKDASYWLTKYAETVTGNQAAMVPLVRDVWRPISQSIFYPDDPFSLQKDRAKITSAFDTFVQIANAGVTLRAATMDKKDLSDVVRESGRALNRVTGNPDMITDGLANAIEYYTAPETERDLQMFIGKTLMDRKYPKPAAAKRSTTKKVKATKKNAAKKKAKNKVK